MEGLASRTSSAAVQLQLRFALFHYAQNDSKK